MRKLLNQQDDVFIRLDIMFFNLETCIVNSGVNEFMNVGSTISPPLIKDFL